MKRALLALLGILLTIVVTALQAEETVTVDGAVVPIAEGWKRADKDDAVILTPRDLPTGVMCTFTLLGGVPFNGSVKDQMTAEWKPFEALGTMANDTGTSIQGEGGPVEVAARAGRIDNAGKNSAYVLLFVVKANQRVERMVFVTGSPEAMQKYANEVAGMVSRAKFVAPKPPEPLKGVCFGFVKVKTSVELECWIFLPDGVVFKGFPYGGPAEMDLQNQLKRRAGDAGEYRIEGEDLLVTMKKTEQPMRFTVSKGAWATPVTRTFQERHQLSRANFTYWNVEVNTTLRITRAEPCDGLKLSGKYKREFSFEEKIPTIQFTADGQFTEDGIIHKVDPGILKEGGGTEPSVAPEKGGSGKYAIGKNTITLTYQDGTKLSLTFLATKEELEKRAPEGIFVHATKLVLIP